MMQINDKKKTPALGLVVTILVLLAVCQGRAETINLPLVDAATATDTGPQDGGFDAFVPLNLGSVNNNGWTSLRTAMEFSLAGLPAHATINSATFSWLIHAWECPRSVAVHGYIGDGAVRLGDFSCDAPVAEVTVEPQVSNHFSTDVTTFLWNLQSAGEPFAGFNFRENPANGINYEIMHMTLSAGATPALSVNYTLVPEPSRIALLGFGVAVLLFSRGEASGAALTRRVPELLHQEH